MLAAQTYVIHHRLVESTLNVLLTGIALTANAHPIHAAMQTLNANVLNVATI